MKKFTFKEVKQYFEDHDCELFETEYINSQTPMKYRCDCGNRKCKIRFNDFKKGIRCIKCSIKRIVEKRKFIYADVYKYFEDHDCNLLETEYINCITPMEYECSCGNDECKITFDSFKSGSRCMECSGSKKYTLEEVKKYFKDHNCELLETEYINNHTSMEYKCDCGNDECKIRFSSFKRGRRCEKCTIKKKSGKNSPSWNPNLTDEEREKNKSRNSDPENNKWRRKVFGINYYTCQCCFKIGGRLIAHHIESYGPNKELRTVLSNGITFCEKHHIEFHKKYGYGHNNREQLNEFLKKYQKNSIISEIT